MKYLLFPFAIMYDLVTTIRNRLYDQGYKPSASFDLPVIVVGNLSVGGTGKTPMVEYLIRLFHPSVQIATLSRGYKRKTKGFRLLASNDDAITVGDEPFQLFKKFNAAFPVAVAEERVLGISMLVDEFPELQAILLDDAFQHRRVKGSFNILLTDYNSPFYNDFLLPMGRLRESRAGASRADVIVVTKCPEFLPREEQITMEDKIKDYAGCPVFFTTIRYGFPTAVSHTHSFEGRVVLVSGIANPTGFEAYARKHFQILKHFQYPDHHIFSESEVRAFVDFTIREKAAVLTTEKDAIRLQSGTYRTVLAAVPFFYLPIESEFLKNGKDFDEMVLNALQSQPAPEANS